MSAAPARGSALSMTEWLFVAIGAAAFAPALLELVTVWRETDYLTHCFMVPVIAAFLAADQVALQRGRCRAPRGSFTVHTALRHRSARSRRAPPTRPGRRNSVVSLHGCNTPT